MYQLIARFQCQDFTVSSRFNHLSAVRIVSVKKIIILAYFRATFTFLENWKQFLHIWIAEYTLNLNPPILYVIWYLQRKFSVN